DGRDPETARQDPSAAGRALSVVFGVAERRGLEAFGIWTSGEVTTVVLSSAGVHGTDSVTDAYVKVICRDGAGRSGFSAAAGRSVRALDPAAAAEEAARKATPGERVELPAGEYDVVLDADAVGVLLEFVGSLAFNGLAHAE